MKRTTQGIALVFALTGCTYSGYERGTVRRFEVQKELVSESLTARAFWIDAVALANSSAMIGVRDSAGGGGGGRVGSYGKVLQLAVTTSSEFRWNRHIEYNSILWSGGVHPMVVLWEVLEFATSPLYLPIIAGLALSGNAPPETETFTMPFSSRLMIASGPINPFVGIFGVSVHRTELVDEVIFEEDLPTVATGVTLPARGMEFSYRLLDSAGREVGTGSATTDPFGEAVVGADSLGLQMLSAFVPDLPSVSLAESVVAIDVTLANGQSARVPVR